MVPRKSPRGATAIPTIALTQRAVDALNPPRSGRVEYFDRTLPGFGLRVASGGRKTWFVMYRVNGRKVRETIGPLASLPKVGDARERARSSLQQAEAGVHPVEARKAVGQLAATFETVLDRYLTEHVARNTRPATLREVRRSLERDVKPRWAGKPITSVTRQDVSELVDAVADRGALIQSNRTLAHLKTFFSWTLDRGLVETDPTARVRKRAKEVARDRALSDEEIRLFWSACDRIGWPFGPLFKLLLLTAQRRDEVGAMAWGELDLGARLWTIPRQRAKNDRTHEVHLSAMAVEILEALPRFASDEGRTATTGTELVFTTNGARPVSGFSKAKAAVDQLMLTGLRSAVEKRRGERDQVRLEPWILHDLRRTAATGMARLNIQPHVVDRILNHVSGTIRGVAAVYNRHAYLEERKAALEAWGRYVENHVRPTPENVVQFGRPE